MAQDPRSRGMATDAVPFEDLTTIDTDVHVTVPHEDVARYLDEPHASYMRDCKGGPLPSDGWDTYLSGKIHHDDFTEAGDLHEACRRFHIDHPIVNVQSKVTRLPQSDLAVALARAYNDALADMYLDEVDYAFGLVTVATQKPHAAAEELDRWGDDDRIVGAYIVDAGPSVPLGDERYDVLYDAMEDNGLTAVYHSSAGGFMFDFARQNQALETYLEMNTLCHVYSHMLHATSLVVQGTPVKFPDLDFAFLEAGQGWIPTLMYRLNKEYYMRKQEAPLLEKTPEEYLRGFYYGTQPIDEPNDPAHLTQLLRMIGTESVMFSTDLPHWNFDNPRTTEEHFADFTDEERRRMVHDNAAEAFGLDV